MAIALRHAAASAKGRVPDAVQRRFALLRRAGTYSQVIDGPRISSALRRKRRNARHPGHDVSDYPPRIGGIDTWSRRQLRRSISSQGWNCRSLPMQIRTSLSRVRLQVTPIADVVSPGLALTKAASMSAGATILASESCRYSSGIFTAARALRMVSK